MSLRTSNLKRLFRLFILIVVFSTPGTSAISAVIDEIASDFKPLSGVVVLASDGEYIIDLDESNGIVIGDIFSVLKAEKKIIHPKTGKVLGVLEEVKGILKVTRIKPGYSFTQPLGKAAIQRGDSIRRYDNLQALFWDYTEKGKSFFVQLQQTLPGLKWQDYETAQHSRPSRPQAVAEKTDTLYFILTPQGVVVRDPQFYVLHSYDLPEALMPVSAAPSAMAETTPQAKLAPTPIVTQPTPSVASKIKTPPADSETPLRFKPQFARAQTIGPISGFSIMTDFIKSGNQLLMASTDGVKIAVYNVADHLTPVAEGTPSYPGQILALKWWQPMVEGPLFLAVSSWADTSISGDIFTLDGNNLVPLHTRIPRILGSFDMDGDKRPETLFAQSLDRENFFGYSVRKLKLVNGKIKYSNPEITLPRRFPVVGSLFADLTGDGQLETVFIRGNILYIYNLKNLLYRSPKEIGGSLSFLTYYVDPTAKNVMPTSASIEVSPVATDLDGDGQLEILVVASEKNIAGAVKASPGVKKSWVDVLKFKDGRFVKGTLGEEMDTPLQGLMVEKSRVLFVTTTPGDIFGKGRSSHLLAYNLEL
jgi:hypothetical protein